MGLKISVLFPFPAMFPLPEPIPNDQSRQDCFFQALASPDSDSGPFSWSALEAGSSLSILAWVTYQLIRLASKKSSRDDRLLSEAVRAQSEQTARLINLIATEQAETKEALIELNDVVEALKSAIAAAHPPVTPHSKPHEQPASVSQPLDIIDGAE